MPKKTIRDVPLQGRKVLIRADLNVPVSETGEVLNDRRIRATLPTIQTALDQGAAVVLMSHLGRPTGDPRQDARYSLKGVGERLSALLGRPVERSPEIVGAEAARMARALKPGQVLLLENLRFHPGEKQADPELARQLAALADLYVNDAFGTSHNEKDASMVVVPQYFPAGQRVAGLLLVRELDVLDRLLGNPRRPMVAILGGAKVSDKIRVIDNLLPRIDRLLIGGAMTYTFLKAAGRQVGRSRVEDDSLDEARRLTCLAGDKMVLPKDHLVAARLDAGAETRTVSDDFPPDWYGVDIGAATRADYAERIRRAKTVVWNGPMGKFEDEPFSHGTRAIADAMAGSDAVTVVGGGETAEAVEEFGLADKMTHVSTGGGAFLAYLGGEPFPSLRMLDDRERSAPE